MVFDGMISKTATLLWLNFILIAFCIKTSHLEHNSIASKDGSLTITDPDPPDMERDNDTDAVYRAKPLPYNPVTLLKTHGKSKRAKHSKRNAATGAQDEEEVGMETLCKTFTEGGDHEFFSPNFPNPYPEKVDCIRVIEAPKNYLVKLDFRGEYFDIESSEGCEFDHLEIRDGGYGYSNVMGTYCGNSFPPMIISTNRFMFLRFRSDSNIQLRGFKAIFEFIPRPASSPPELEDCVFEYNNITGAINNTDIPEEMLEMSAKTSASLDCLWKITAEPGMKISLLIVSYKLSFPNECARNYLDILNDETLAEKVERHYCGSAAEGLNSKNNIIYVRFYAESAAVEKSEFAIVYTAFRERFSNQSCNADEYDCQDNSCIDKSLRCDGSFNCRYKWDEENCAELREEGMPQTILIIITFFCIGFVMVCAGLIYKCVTKLRKDHQKIQEHLAQSRSQINLNDLIKENSKLQCDLPPIPVPTFTVDDKSSLRNKRTKSQRSLNRQHSVTSLHRMRRRSSSIYSTTSHKSRKTNQGALKDTSTSIDTRLNDMEDLDVNSSNSLNRSYNNFCSSGCQTRESLFQTLPINPVKPLKHEQYRAEVAISVHQPSAPPYEPSHSSSASSDQRAQPKVIDKHKSRREAVLKKSGSEKTSESSSNEQQPQEPQTKVKERKKVDEDNNTLVIDVQQKKTAPAYQVNKLKVRPFSVQSTKSAPDVIVNFNH